jgi:hypothetical protein
MSQINSFQGSFLPPGQLPSIESIEQDITSVIWNRLDIQVIGSNQLISGAARDAGNTGFTDVLRPGLLLTKDANGLFVDFGSVVSLAADLVEGVLLMAQKMTRNGANQDKYLGYILLGGCVKQNGVLVPGAAGANALTGHTNETFIRTSMKYTMRFDDDPFSHKAT